MEEKISENIEKLDSDTNKPKFYQTQLFIWLMLVAFAPVGIFLLWKHSKYNKFIKSLLTFIFAVIFLGIICGDDSSKTSRVKVNIVDFSVMNREQVQDWCTENKMNCIIGSEYSDTVKAGEFLAQSVPVDKVVNEGEKISILYSLGKEPSLEFKNALKTAEVYSSLQHMSKQAIYEQLVSEYGEGFPADAAKYAIENLNANWNENALKTAQNYSQSQHMSKRGIYEQLTSSYGEKFTPSEAQYAIDNIQADWNENALQTAKSYLQTQNMSKQALYQQLTSSYGEKFTPSEAKYAVDNIF